jgi:peptidoglycan/LPS O-acetylase OafA/YrhL
LSVRVEDRTAGRRNNFDFLRFIAASLVIVSHSYYIALGTAAADLKEPLHTFTHGQLSLGSVGLAIFFVISGFLVTQSYERRAHLAKYLKARSLRIFPALVVVVALSSFVLGPAVTSLRSGVYFTSSETYSYLLNVFLVHPRFFLPGVFEHNAYPLAVNGPLWTLRYEFAFYLVVAGCGLLPLFRGRGRLVVAVATISCILFATFVPRESVPGVIYQVARLYSWFGMGMLLYLYRSRVPLDWRLTLLAVVAIVAAARLGYLDAVFAVAGAYLIVYLALWPGLPLASWARYGDISYGLYIYAFPVQQTVSYLLGGHPGVGQVLFISFPITVCLAALSWHLVERRALSLKDLSVRSALIRWREGET